MADHTCHIVAETASLVLAAGQDEGKEAALVDHQRSAAAAIFVKNPAAQNVLGLHMALDGLSVVLVVHGVADVLGHKIDRRRKFLIFARAYLKILCIKYDSTPHAEGCFFIEAMPQGEP